jgi:WD40 repeat protein
MVTAGEDKVARIWDTRSGAMLKELKGHQGWIYRVAWNDNHIISASEDGTARIWDPDSGKRISTIPASPGWWVYSAEISGDGGRVALASEDGKVFIYGDEFLSPISELMSVEQQLRKLTELERQTYLHEAPSNTR